MDDHLGEARLEIGDRLQVKLLPFIPRNLWIGNHDRVEQDIVLRERWLRLGARLASHSEKGEMILVRNLDIGCHQLGRREERAHMAIEMRRMNSERQRANDLSADLTLDISGLCLCRNYRLVIRKGAGRIEQARNLVRRLDATPAIRLPFTGEREVQPEIRVRVRPRVSGDFADPRRRDHDARRRDRALVEPIEARRIDGMRGAEVVGVNNQELRVGRMAESFGDGPRLGGKRSCKSERCDRRPKQWLHGKLVRS